MIVGNIKKIDLSASSFERMITHGNLYVDKTRFIEHFLNASSSVQLIARHRRLGKSLNMDMLRCFLTDKTDYRHLFKGLYIETSSVWNIANSTPAFYFDFKGLKLETYREQIIKQVDKHVNSIVEPTMLSGYFKRQYEQITNDLNRAEDSLYFLTELTFELTGKRSYILIDEYDKLLIDNYSSDKYDEIRAFETSMLSSALKGNHYLEKGLLTGVMRVSHESMFSGLNNVKTFDVFNDQIYTDDYGLTDREITELSQLADFAIDELKSWYNGVKISGQAIYNTYSVMSYLDSNTYGCFWGKSGTLDMISNLLNDNRKLTLTKLLNGEQTEVSIDDRISLKQLSSHFDDKAFYSLLLQGGYLTLDKYVANKDIALVSIPNHELLVVWKNFIFGKIYRSAIHVRTLFDNENNLAQLAKDLEYFLSDRLSYHDLASYEGESKTKTYERIYHVFLLGILSAYDDVRCRYPLSNRESGDGRFDILIERTNAYYIFECKACDKKSDLVKEVNGALSQIDANRYGADLKKDKRLIKIGIAFCGKLCKVKCK